MVNTFRTKNLNGLMKAATHQRKSLKQLEIYFHMINRMKIELHL